MIFHESMDAKGNFHFGNSRITNEGNKFKTPIGKFLPKAIKR